MVQHQLHKPKYLSLGNPSFGLSPHFRRFASETVNKAPMSDQRGRQSLQAGLGPHPTWADPASLILAFFFSSKNFLGQREKSQEPSVYQASFYQICVKGQRGKIMRLSFTSSIYIFVWSQKCHPLTSRQHRPFHPLTPFLGRKSPAHLQGVSLGPQQERHVHRYMRSSRGGRVRGPGHQPAASNTHRAHTGQHRTHPSPVGRPPHPERFEGMTATAFHITIMRGWIPWQLTAKGQEDSTWLDETREGPEAAGE